MKTIQEMARDAQLPYFYQAGEIAYLTQLESFAALVEAAARADEREACAKVADDYFGFNAIADAIRARSHT